MGVQPMRTTQLIFNHGPGSILETVDGPAVVRTWDCLEESIEIQSRGFPLAFEISETRLTNLLAAPNNSRARLHRIPSNVELSKNDNWFSIKTNLFPYWLLCNRSNQCSQNSILYLQQSADRGGANCPVCNEKGSAIRFVSYCTDGHMDDIDWRRKVCGPHPSPACQESYLEWRETDASIQGVVVSCPSCNNSSTLGEISKNLGPCSGRHPERRDSLLRPGCANKLRAKLTQRQSTILWQSISQKVISVPSENPTRKFIEELFPILIVNRTLFATILGFGQSIATAGTHHPVYARLGVLTPSDPDLDALIAWMVLIQLPSTPAHLHSKMYTLITRICDSGDIGEFRDEWDDLIGGGTVNSSIESYRMELEGLLDSSRPIDLPNPSGQIIFSMENAPQYANFGSLRIKAEPIQKLRTVTALTGYTRGAVADPESNTLPNPVNLSHLINGDDWYAANEAYGEGILLTLDHESQPHDMGQERASLWKELHKQVCSDAIKPNPTPPIPWRLFRSARVASSKDADWRPKGGKAPEFFAESHPLFVWWHTFAHHLIRAIQADTGYSSAAIAERIYAVPERDGNWRGAIVLYVTDGGMDGTLGGLTSLLPNLQMFLNRIISDGLVCSNDPLCEQAPSRLLPDIACYACTMNPETSCEHRNMFLDRLLLFEAAQI